MIVFAFLIIFSDSKEMFHEFKAFTDLFSPMRI